MTNCPNCHSKHVHRLNANGEKNFTPKLSMTSKYKCQLCKNNFMGYQAVVSPRSVLTKALSLTILLSGLYLLVSEPEVDRLAADNQKPLGVAGLSADLQKVYEPYVLSSPIWEATEPLVTPEVVTDEPHVEEVGGVSKEPRLEVVGVVSKEPLKSVN